MINLYQLMLDLKELEKDMIERVERAHNDTKSHVADSEDWNFHVGQLDTATTSSMENQTAYREILMIDVKDVVIEDLKRTLSSLERTLRAAGSIDMKAYHNSRDTQLAKEFIKMADAAVVSLVFADANLVEV